jgi:parallel beta-helix repeat protein
MAEEVFTNDAQTVITSGGTSAPPGGTSETWTVASPGAFPTASSAAARPTTFHVVDTAFPTEIIAVTNTSGGSWTVIRGAEGSTPIAHSPGFAVKQAITAGVLANLRDAAAVFNVRTEFLAAGDGVTIDSAAFSHAVTALNAAGGGTLLVPAGIYVMSDVKFGSNITVRGAGMGATVFLMDPAAASGAVVCRVAPASHVTATANMVLSDLTIDGNKDRWGPDSNQKGYGYYLGQGTPGLITYCKCINVEIRNCLTYSFDVENATDISLESCWAHDNGYTTGIGTEHDCDGLTLIGSDITAVNCRSYDNAERGYLCGQDNMNWARIKLIGCSARGNGNHGASLGSNSGGTLTDSEVIGGSYINNSGTGVQLGTNAVRCRVTGATMSGNSANGMSLNTASYCAVTGNTVYNNATATASNPEIHLNTTSTNNAITGNVVNSANASHAISEQADGATDYNAITGNNVTSTGTTIVLHGAHSLASNNVGYNTALAASANFKPPDPSSTTSGTLVMMGLGSTVRFTPNSTGKIEINFTCEVGNAGASTNVTVGPRYGTMTAPANGAAITGTRFGLGSDALIRPATSSASSAVSTFACTDVITGLTTGTAYWFDIAIDTSNPSKAAFIQNVSVSIAELAA